MFGLKKILLCTVVINLFQNSQENCIIPENICKNYYYGEQQCNSHDDCSSGQYCCINECSKTENKICTFDVEPPVDVEPNPTSFEKVNTIPTTASLPHATPHREYFEICPRNCLKDTKIMEDSIRICFGDADCPISQKCCTDSCWTENRFCKPISLIYVSPEPNKSCPDTCILNEDPFPKIITLCDLDEDCFEEMKCCMDTCYETNICKRRQN